MTTKAIRILIFIVAATLVISSIGSTPQGAASKELLNPVQIVGSWEAEDGMFYRFDENGTTFLEMPSGNQYNGNWKLINDNIIITMMVQKGYHMVGKWGVSFVGHTMTFTPLDGNQIVVFYRSQ